MSDDRDGDGVGVPGGDPVALTPAVLRDWPLPDRRGSKDRRGAVLVVGGARGTVGAVLLAGVAALRVGAGRLSLAVAGSVAPALAVAVPEAGVTGLPETAAGSLVGSDAGLLDGDLERARAVVLGPGLDEPDGTRALLRAVATRTGTDVPVLLDAFALGVLPSTPDVHDALAGRLVLTPNGAEADRLLGDDEGGAHGSDREVAHAIAARFGAVVALSGTVVAPDGRAWTSPTGASGLGTSGSGDVLAGAVAGLLAGGTPTDQAACWGVSMHGLAGDRLAARVGPLGYLARELCEELPRVLVELTAR
ncbi:NAD(P)H-hydrate dehydratase [Cellulomonas marina]|uniref:ADP-dependent (S)-NAD(P)H-hydrate dehydratase n=1 Tax=Cellulomonas marina TaxID=988821 RepID=A0A1I1AFN8_9CELL|nr:NAD(P)H-hydrate dehydratase [Cellulomonas marina]GIG29699.1 ADP-dependent (S)-NAD(P)H-hydrate dehydratase [Cellulomonas marina]SFB36176.1 yjeF C-terminal region, hydroxyethylthiazole kinase-related [Cellulomonas marina]